LTFARTSPDALDDEHARAFLEHLALEGNVAAATQNQALNALVFLHRVVLESPLGQLEAFAPAKRPRRLPVVLTHEEVRALLSAMRGTHRLMAELLYGSGLRLIECLRLRVKDIDFSRGEITVREGKGNKDRLTLLPQSIAADLAHHLETVRALHQQDRGAGFGAVFLPGALERKYPGAVTA
jgi:site-specific recombinase XerD